MDPKAFVLTLASTFLALGMGFLVGMNVVGTPAFLREEEGMVSRLEGDFAHARKERMLLEEELAAQRRELLAVRRFADEAEARLVSDRLTGRHVAVVVLDADFDPSLLLKTMRHAGAVPAPVVRWAPEGPGASTMEDAEALGAWLVGKGDLPGTGWHMSVPGTSGPDGAIVVVGGLSARKVAPLGLALVRALVGHGVPVVAADTRGTPAPLVASALFRRAGVATVRDISTHTGRVSAVLGLLTRGDWGSKAGDAELMPW